MIHETPAKTKQMVALACVDVGFQKPPEELYWSINSSNPWVFNATGSLIQSCSVLTFSHKNLTLSQSNSCTSYNEGQYEISAAQGVEIKMVTAFNYLGIIIDQKLSFVPHTESLVSNLNYCEMLIINAPDLQLDVEIMYTTALSIVLLNGRLFMSTEFSHWLLNVNLSLGWLLLISVPTCIRWWSQELEQT